MEIAKSVSFKVNIGDFQSLDFFCSAKMECEEKDQDTVGAKLHAYCKAQVIKDYNVSMKSLAVELSPKRKEELVKKRSETFRDGSKKVIIKGDVNLNEEIK